MDPLPTFEGTEVLERIRSGPVADLYRAVQKPLGRTVTIKALGASIVPASPFAAALEREARLLAQLGHPNVIGLYDFVRHDERMWLVLENVEGWTLAEVLAKTGQLPQSAAVFVARALASALEHAHERGLIHRDLRPQHVLVSRSGDVKLTDFAVAADERLPTAPEILSGATGPPSLAYASPEQILGEPPDPRSDLFSLGVVLYELVAGKAPFGAADDRGATSRIRNDPPPPLGRFVTDLSPALERVVLRCLQKLPSDRFQSAVELGEALALAERELGGGPPRAGLLAAMHDAGFETSGGPPQRIEKEPTTRPAKSVGRATLVLFFLCLVSVAGGAVIQFLAQRSEGSTGDRDARGRLELSPPNPGYLRVVAQPWAHVIVDGQKLETTPFARPIPLAPGTHYVRLEHPLAPTERRTLSVAGGETIVLDVVMHVRGPRADTMPFTSAKPPPPLPVDSSP
ncbi:MAG TPA: serine/threonine-protein kinase [Polyangiaceae bacterium]